MSVRLSVRPSAWNNSAPTGRILMKLDILTFFKKSVEEIQASLNPARITGTLHEDFQIYDNTALNSF
jgi:hypothetical protein